MNIYCFKNCQAWNFKAIVHHRTVNLSVVTVPDSSHFAHTAVGCGLTVTLQLQIARTEVEQYWATTIAVI